MEIFHVENFRFLRQAHYTTMPWDWIQGELWLKLQAFRKPLPSNMPTLLSKSKLEFVPRHYSFRFHKDKKCDLGCVYNHNCFICEGSRPVTKSNFHDSSRQSRSRPQPANSFPNANKSRALTYSS